MTIDDYLGQIDEKTRNKLEPIIEYIAKEFPDVTYDEDWGPKTKMPTYRHNGNYVSIACMKRYISIHFSNYEAPKLIFQKYPYCKANVGCVNFSYARDLPHDVIFEAIDQTLGVKK